MLRNLIMPFVDTFYVSNLQTYCAHPVQTPLQIRPRKCYVLISFYLYPKLLNNVVHNNLLYWGKSEIFKKKMF